MDLMVPKNLKTKLRKALTVTTGSEDAVPLIPEDLEPAIREYLFYMSPLSDMISNVEADGHVHKVVRRTAINRGWFEGEEAEPSYGNSEFERRSVEVKILRTHGKVTDFAVSAARSFTDAWAGEIEGATLAFADLFEYQAMWGCSDEMDDLTGDAYQSPGIYAWLLDDAADDNVIDQGGTVDLSMLDSMFAVAPGKYRNFRRDPYVWLMSQDMVDKVSGLQTRISREVPTIEYEGAFTMTTYKGVPILPSAFCAAEENEVAGLTAASSDGAGGFDDDGTTYYYKVAAISLYGEKVASAEANEEIGDTTGHDTITLSWTADEDAKLYAIYRGTSTGDDNLELIDIIPGKTYSDGVVDSDVTEYVDLGVDAVGSDLNPLASGDETVWLVNMGPRYGVSRPVLTPEQGSPVGALLRYEDIPVATDEMAFRLKSYSTIQVPNGKSMAVARRVKTS